MADWTEQLANFGKPQKEEEDPVMKRVHSICEGVALTSVQFAERHPEGVFCLFDFDENRAGTLVQLPYFGVQNTLMLHELEGTYSFSKDLDRVESLRGYLGKDYEALAGVFTSAHKMKPRKIWFMVDLLNNRKKIVLDYTPRSTKLLDFENSLGEWKDVLTATGWQNFII